LEGKLSTNIPVIRNLERTVTILKKKNEEFDKSKNKPGEADKKAAMLLEKKVGQLEKKVANMTTPSPSMTRSCHAVVANPLSASADIVMLPKAAFEDYVDARLRHENHNMAMATHMVSNQHHLSYLSNVNQVSI
jgi:hypothetical protein